MATDQQLRRLPLVVDLDEVPQGGDLRSLPLKLHKEIDHTGLPGVGAGGGGLYASIAIIADEKPDGTPGGANASGDWRTRELNTELGDPDGIVSIASNQFTLQAGTYLIEARSTLNINTNNGIARIRNITDDATEIVGVHNASTDGGIDLVGLMTIAAAKVFELQVRTIGTGIDFSFSSGEVSIFNTVKITKLG